MLNDPRSHGLWERTAPPPPETSKLAGPIKVQVAVVGGGFTGLSAALHLAEAGAEVAVLESVEIGFGASGRNVGLVNAGMWVMPEDIPGILGAEHGERLLNLLGNGPADVFELVAKHGIDCELEKSGTLHCSVGKAGLKDLEERARQWAARGAPVHLLDKVETARRIGSSAYEGSLLDLRAGTIQPLAYVRGLARAAIEAGARIFTQSPATRIEPSNGKWFVHTPDGFIEADWVVAATDAYTTGPWPEIRQEQVHLPYFNFATRPLSDNLRKSILPGREGCWDTKQVLSSFRFDRQGRLVFGSVGALRNGGEVVHRAWAKRALAKLFPQTGEVDFEAEWYGMIGMTGDHLPKFHKFEPNVVGICGYNGRGIAPGTVLGRVLAEHILGKCPESQLPLPVTIPAEQNFRAIREAYYEAGAQIAHLAGARF